MTFKFFDPYLFAWGMQVKRVHLPLQVHSSLEYPVLHEQLYDPLVLLHTALALHLWVSVVEHSLKSEILIKEVQSY